jgi:hypothetical protein
MRHSPFALRKPVACERLGLRHKLTKGLPIEVVRRCYGGGNSFRGKFTALRY